MIKNNEAFTNTVRWKVVHDLLVSEKENFKTKDPANEWQTPIYAKECKEISVRLFVKLKNRTWEWGNKEEL